MVCLLVADDLTGAADACAKFVARGFSGTVLLTPDAVSAASGDQADVLAINLDTRRLKEPEARRRIRDAAHHAAPQRHPVIFKKIDSTLRGHIGAELEEAMAAFSCTHAIVAPAFPGMGRIMREGHLIVMTSPAGNDGRGPGSDSTSRAGSGAESRAASERVLCDVAGLLVSQGVRDVVAIPASGMPAPPAPGAAALGAAAFETAALGPAGFDAAAPDAEAFAAALARALGGGERRVLVCDAVSQRDLDHLVLAASDAIAAAGGRPLWVGSAGLADAVAAYLARSHAPDSPAIASTPLPPLSPRGGCVLLFIGSTHPVTREQQRHLLDAGIANVATDAVALRDALNRAGRHHALVTLDWSRADLRTVHDLLRAADLTGDRAAAGDHAHPANAAADAAAGAAADPHSPATATASIAGFVMSGGDTAADICQAMGADRLCLGGEVADGIPCGLLRGGRADGLPLVLKSGGFGAPDALVHAVHFLTGTHAPDAPHAPHVPDVPHARS